MPSHVAAVGTALVAHFVCAMEARPLVLFFWLLRSCACASVSHDNSAAACTFTCLFTRVSVRSVRLKE